MHTKKLYGILWSCFLLGGCMQAIHPDMCKDDKWFDRGFEDGAQGESRNAITEIQRACQAYNLPIDQQTYSEGFRAGRRTKCTLENGMADGKEGLPLIQDCPADLQATYTQAWTRGMREYCKPTTGFALGQQGASMPHYCPKEVKIAFEAAYHKGKYLRLHGTHKDKEKYALYYQIDELSEQIEKQDKKILDAQNKKTPHSEALQKQHRAYRDHLIEQKMDLEKKIGLNE